MDDPGLFWVYARTDYLEVGLDAVQAVSDSLMDRKFMDRRGKVSVSSASLASASLMDSSVVVLDSTAHSSVTLSTLWISNDSPCTQNIPVPTSPAW